MLQLTDKVILITGASRGLGRALALDYARNGAALIINSRAGSADELEAVRREVETIGAQVLAVVADVSDPADVERLAAEAMDRFGRVDVLVNNASALGPTPMPYLLDYPLPDFVAVMRTNLTGPFVLTRALLGQMVLRGSGSVINVSSDAGVVGYPTWGAYGVSKAAIDQLTRTWAAELDGTGVRVNSVDPGNMNTAMHRAAEPEEDPTQWADPTTVTPLFLYLASDRAAAINGQRFEAQAWTEQTEDGRRKTEELAVVA